MIGQLTGFDPASSHRHAGPRALGVASRIDRAFRHQIRTKKNKMGMASPYFALPSEC